MESIVLRVIPKPEPGTLTVKERSPSDKETVLLFKGIEVYPDLCCGNCKALLAVGTLPSMIQGIALRCNACGSYNTA